MVDFFNNEGADTVIVSHDGGDKKVNSDKSNFDVLDLILITSIFAANWSLLRWGSKFTKSKAGRLCSLFVGVIMKLSNFGSSLSDCQILGAPCQIVSGWQERVTSFQPTFALWEPNIPFRFSLKLFLLSCTKTLSEKKKKYIDLVLRYSQLVCWSFFAPKCFLSRELIGPLIFVFVNAMVKRICLTSVRYHLSDRWWP